MRLNSSVAIITASLLLAPAAIAQKPAVSPADLDAVRQQTIAAARTVQQREAAIAADAHAIDLYGRDADARKRGLGDSRPEQAHLLAAIMLSERRPPVRLAAADTGPLDEEHRDLLVRGTVPGMRTELRLLTGEIDRIAALRQEIDKRTVALNEARDALPQERGSLAGLVAQRLDLTRKLLPDDPATAARITRLAHDAPDLGDLIKRADAATEHRDKDILARAKTIPPAKGTKPPPLTVETADPTRPHPLAAFDPPQSSLTTPVSGTVSLAFGAADAGGSASQGITLAAALPAGAEVVAPFDGRIVYAGPFRTLGLVLIIRHGGGYHSLLAGLGRIDAKVDHWVRSGEPVGALPDAAGSADAKAVKTESGILYFELRRDDHPVDPQPWLANRDDARNDRSSDQSGDRKVRE